MIKMAFAYRLNHKSFVGHKAIQNMKGLKSTYDIINCILHPYYKGIFCSIVPFNLHPTSITQMVNIFSASVFGATLPKPTDVNDVNVK